MKFHHLDPGSVHIQRHLVHLLINEVQLLLQTLIFLEVLNLAFVLEYLCEILAFTQFCLCDRDLSFPVVANLTEQSLRLICCLLTEFLERNHVNTISWQHWAQILVCLIDVLDLRHNVLLPVSEQNNKLFPGTIFQFLQSILPEFQLVQLSLKQRDLQIELVYLTSVHYY